MPRQAGDSSQRHLTEVPIISKSPDSFSAISGAEAVVALRGAAASLSRRLAARTVWNVNSTAAGGGVAEMLHALLPYARGLGIPIRWLVIDGDPKFFRITKRLHNALHGEAGDGSPLGAPERARYERSLAGSASEMAALVTAGDIVILHDPQTAGLAPSLSRAGAEVIWRCHIGDDRRTDQAQIGWDFLAPYLPSARAFVFSRAAYVPEVCDHGRSVIVPPSIDPFSPKNVDLDAATVRAVLTHTGLVAGRDGVAPRITLDGGRARAIERKTDVVRDGPPPPPDAPLVVQVSRWDRLKDPVGVLEAFARIDPDGLPQGAHLVLAGPSVAGVADDPEGAQVHDDVIARWRALPAGARARIHLATLPMDDLEENAAIVNALQRHAAVVVQKSLREGFGLTVTEAMWKSRPVLASAVGGIQDQIEHGVSGLLVQDPEDLDAFAAELRRLLADRPLGERLGQGARRRAVDLFLGIRSLSQYAALIERLDTERHRES